MAVCGICGVAQVGPGERRQQLAPGVLAAMTDAMAHRGPDDRGLVERPGVALGARRLSIIDVDGGHQPFSNEDGTVWAAQNGELYNHSQLRLELREQGHIFRSRCDTEILPHLYERAPQRLPQHLRGKFGIAVWDDRREQLLLVRDRLGVKPLYYAQVGDQLLFASELKSLLASGLVPCELDYPAIDAYLTLGFFPTPHTPLQHVRKLPPGHQLTAGHHGVQVTSYWDYPLPAPDPAPKTAEHYAGRLLEILDEAVRLRLMSDRPLGAMLSGGLDSSLVVALMARHMQEPVKTFSVGFEDESTYDELPQAQQVASLNGADHHQLRLSLTDLRFDLPTLVWHLDEPLADLSTVGFHSLSHLASQHVTVALSGQGADELFGGYERHRKAALVARWTTLPGPLRTLSRLALNVGPERARRLATVLRADDAVERALRLYGRADLPALGKHESLVRAVLAGHLMGTERDPLGSLLHLDAKLSLVDDMLHYFDRNSMAHSLEVRVPFLDHHLVEYAATIPPQHKVKGLTTKHVLKLAAKGLVPDNIIHKRKIGFFNRSVENWLQAQTEGALSDYLLDSNAHYGDLLDRAAVERLLRREGAEAAVRPELRGHLLLSVLMLEVWLTTYLPRATRTTAPALFAGLIG